MCVVETTTISQAAIRALVDVFGAFPVCVDAFRSKKGGKAIISVATTFETCAAVLAGLDLRHAGKPELSLALPVTRFRS